MPDLQITVQPAPGAAVAAVTKTAAVAAANDNQFDNDSDGKLLIFIENGAGAKSGTVRSVPCSHGRSEDIPWTVAANTLYVVGPLPASLFNTAAGLVEVNVDDATNLTMWAIRVPEAG
jgi:hypothetical protein